MIRGFLYAGLATTVWLAGYVYGYMVGEREGQDSDPDDRPIVGATNKRSSALYPDGSLRPEWEQGPGYAGGSVYYQRG